MSSLYIALGKVIKAYLIRNFPHYESNFTGMITLRGTHENLTFERKGSREFYNEKGELVKTWRYHYLDGKHTERKSFESLYAQIDGEETFYPQWEDTFVHICIPDYDLGNSTLHGKAGSKTIVMEPAYYSQNGVCTRSYDSKFEKVFNFIWLISLAGFTWVFGYFIPNMLGIF